MSCCPRGELCPPEIPPCIPLISEPCCPMGEVCPPELPPCVIPPWILKLLPIGLLVVIAGIVYYQSGNRKW